MVRGNIPHCIWILTQKLRTISPFAYIFMFLYFLILRLFVPVVSCLGCRIYIYIKRNTFCFNGIWLMQLKQCCYVISRSQSFRCVFSTFASSSEALGCRSSPENQPSSPSFRNSLKSLWVNNGRESGNRSRPFFPLHSEFILSLDTV
jgi:hypothetical protein